MSALPAWLWPPGPGDSTKSTESVGNITVSSLKLTKDASAPTLPSRKEYHLYFSYAGATDLMRSRHANPAIQLDMEWVTKVVRVLESDRYGYKCCNPARDFKPGVMTVKECEECISKSLKAVVVLSTEYLKRDWEKFEYDLLRHPEFKIPFLPVLLDNCTVPKLLTGYTISEPFSDRHWWTKFLRAVRGYAPKLAEGKLEHAFFAHSNNKKDTEWVNDVINGLKSIDGSLRCVSAYRDFKPGCSESKCIRYYIEKSMVTFIVLTNNFSDGQWTKYKDYVFSKEGKHVNYVPIKVNEDAFVPLALQSVMPIDATSDGHHWKTQLSDVLFCEGFTDEDLFDPPPEISEITQKVHDRQTSVGPASITVEIPEAQKRHFGYDVNFVKAMSFVKVEMASFCCTRASADDDQSFIQTFAITVKDEILVAETRHNTIHTLSLFSNDEKRLWKMQLVEKPVHVTCTRQLVFVVSRRDRPRRDSVQTVSLKEANTKPKALSSLHFVKCRCILALTDSLLLVSLKEDVCVKTIDVRGECINRLYVRKHFASEIPLAPRQLALSSDGKLLVATDGPSVFCFAPEDLSRGIFFDFCCWVGEVESPICMSSCIDDMFIMMTAIGQSKTRTGLVFLDTNKGEKIYEQACKPVIQARSVQLVICGTNGDIYVLHENKNISLFQIHERSRDHR